MEPAKRADNVENWFVTLLPKKKKLYQALKRMYFYASKGGEEFKIFYKIINILCCLCGNLSHF